MIYKSYLNQTSKLMKEFKTKQKVSGYSPLEVERDIELREMRDFGNSVIQQLGGKAAKQPEMMSTLQLLFSQAGLPPPPSPTASRTGSTLSSARSSTSQLSILSSARYIQFTLAYPTIHETGSFMYSYGMGWAIRILTTVHCDDAEYYPITTGALPLISQSHPALQRLLTLEMWI